MLIPFNRNKKRMSGGPTRNIKSIESYFYFNNSLFANSKRPCYLMAAIVAVRRSSILSLVKYDKQSDHRCIKDGLIFQPSD